MALIRWEPVPMNRLFTSLFDTPTVAAPPVARRDSPSTDIAESESHWILRADLPGVAEEDLDIELDGNVLTISGERRSYADESRDGFRRIERSSGSFRRSLRLPEGVNADAIEASLVRGVLEVSIAKPAQPTPHKIAISAGATPRGLDVTETPSTETPSTEAPASETGSGATDAPASTEPAAA